MRCEEEMAERSLLEKLNKPGKFFVFFIVVLESILMGFANVTIKTALDVLDPVHLNVARWTVAAIGFWILVLTDLVKVEYKGKPFKWALLVGILMPVLYASLESPGIDMISTAEATIILAMIPVMVAFFSIILLKTKISLLSIIAFVVSFIGILFTVDFKHGLQGNLLGSALVFAAVVVGALYIIISRVASKKFSSIELTFIMCNMGAVYFNLIALTKGEFTASYKLIVSSGTTFASVLYLGLVCSLLCYAMLNYGLAFMEPYKASLIGGGLITLTGVSTGVIFKGDILSPLTFLGGVLILIGVILVALDEGRTVRKQKRAKSNKIQ